MMVLIKIILWNLILITINIDFIKEYNKYYENVDVIINDKGKVILNI